MKREYEIIDEYAEYDPVTKICTTVVIDDGGETMMMWLKNDDGSMTRLSRVRMDV